MDGFEKIKKELLSKEKFIVLCSFLQLYNDYPVAPDKVEIKIEVLCIYQLRVADFYNIPTGNVKKFALNLFDKKKMCFIMKTCSFIY